MLSYCKIDGAHSNFLKEKEIVANFIHSKSATCKNNLPFFKFSRKISQKPDFINEYSI